MRVAYVATVGNDPWSRLIREEFGAEGLATDFLEIGDRLCPPSRWPSTSRATVAL
jgi:sugar/nucleoside kinase (ribokinase family)